MRDGAVVLIAEEEIGIGIGMRKCMMIGIGVDVEEEMIVTSGDELFSFLFRTSRLAIVNAFKSGTDLFLIFLFVQYSLHEFIKSRMPHERLHTVVSGHIIVNRKYSLSLTC
jgi:hypothetical protein